MRCADTGESRGIRGHLLSHREAATAAAEYFRGARIPESLEGALNSAYSERPRDVIAYLSNYFAELSNPPVISRVRGRKVLDGAGKDTLEVDVFCMVRNMDKRICSAVISADADMAPSLAGSDVSGTTEKSVKSVERAMEWIQESIGPDLEGILPSEQSTIDQILSDFFKPKMEEERRRREAEQHAAAPPAGSDPTPPVTPPTSKKKGSAKGKKAAVTEKPIPPADPPELVVGGSPAVGAVSLAVATCTATLREVPLYSYISALKHEEMPSKLMLPAPFITLLSYGKSGKLRFMKEVMMVPPPGLTAQQSVELALSLQAQIMKHTDTVGKSGQMVIKSVSALGCLALAADRVEQPLDLIREACEELGLALGTDVYLAINCAAHELMDYNKGKYEVLSGAWKSPEEMVDLYVDLISRYPAVTALVDPLRKEDSSQWETLAKALGDRCYIITDVASRSVSNLLQGGILPASSGAVLKHANQTTVSDLLAAVRLIEGEKQVAVLGCLNEESSEDSMVDLAVGLGVRFMKLGGLLRGERATKYNRLLAIEEDLLNSDRLGSYSQFDFPVLWSEPQVSANQEEAAAVSPR
ncbi:enolase 4 [Hyperolius riggenbachi]|uniref:enolase 4 n=1 Tax=Hyperolius riggenbachi TaxID=752182 RepID=UPI0035A280E8